MKPEKILYVDDEAIALKYFERLVGPLAPVLTANSVDEGRAVLSVHGADIAVLVCDQRMPGERGNELLRHARTHYPHIVRMLAGPDHRWVLPEVLEGLFKHVAALSPDLIAATVAAYLDHDANDVLPTITVPTLIVAGAVALVQGNIKV